MHDKCIQHNLIHFENIITPCTSYIMTLHAVTTDILILIPDSLLETVQMRSRDGYYSDTYSRFSSRNSSDAIQIWLTF